MDKLTMNYDPFRYIILSTENYPLLFLILFTDNPSHRYWVGNWAVRMYPNLTHHIDKSTRSRRFFNRRISLWAISDDFRTPVRVRRTGCACADTAPLRTQSTAIGNFEKMNNKTKTKSKIFIRQWHRGKVNLSSLCSKYTAFNSKETAPGQMPPRWNLWLSCF